MDQSSAKTWGTSIHIKSGKLIRHYPKYIQLGMEHIMAYVRPPWWKLPAITTISPLNKDEAAKAHLQWLSRIPAQDMIIYTDGSGHNGQIGTAIYSPTVRRGGITGCK